MTIDPRPTNSMTLANTIAATHKVVASIAILFIVLLYRLLYPKIYLSTLKP